MRRGDGLVLCRRTVGVAEELRDDVRWRFAAGLGDALETACVLTLDGKEDPQLRLGWPS